MANERFSPATKRRVLEFIASRPATRSDIARALRLAPGTVGKIVAVQRDKYGAEAIITDPRTLHYVMPQVENADMVDAWEKDRRKRVRTEMARTVITMRNYQESIGVDDPAARAVDMAIKAMKFAGDVLDY